MDEFVDKLYENDMELIHEILKYTGKKYYSAPSYCVCLNNEIILHTGGDIIDADNICNFLHNKFPDKNFIISNEHISLSE